MHARSKNIHNAMRSATIARRALVNAYRNNMTASGEKIYEKTLNRINRTIKNATRRNNIKRHLVNAANINTLVKVHGISKNHANKIAKPIHERNAKRLANELLNYNLKFKN